MSPFVSDEQTQTPSSLSSQTPRKLKLKRTVKNLTIQLERKTKTGIETNITAEDVGRF